MRAHAYKPSDYVPVSEAAERIGCSRQTVVRFIEAGRLKGTRYTDTSWWKVHKRSLEGFLAALNRGARRRQS